MGAERQAAWNSSVCQSVCVRELGGVGGLCMAVCRAPRPGQGGQRRAGLWGAAGRSCREEPRGAAGVEGAQPESMLGVGD